MFKHLKHIKMGHVERVIDAGEKAAKAFRYVVENRDEIKKTLDAAGKAGRATHASAKQQIEQGVEALKRRFPNASHPTAACFRPSLVRGTTVPDAFLSTASARHSLARQQ